MGKSVPFAEPIEYEEVVKSLEVQTKEPRVEKREALRPREPKSNVHLVDDEVYTALKAGDFNAAVELFMNNYEKDNMSLKCRRKVLEVLIEENKIDEAAPVATKLANSYRFPKRINFREIFENIADKLDEVKKEEFLSSLPQGLRDILWMRNREAASNSKPNP
eukprot:TRINITY_DN37083_c0_g1_i1.p1 TRINITY_DN37083_c0_g1~~TRINITY_DN37083_c0_g1_i1.p1  ORF type:complete len:186 (-),score=59.71 TRINITY_DN37083_c0_g1_i1:295-783(-)